MCMLEGAACRADSVDPDWFFPGPGGPGKVSLAKRVCAGCPVRDGCLKLATDQGIYDGIFGGLTPDERKAAVARVGGVPHGTLRGYINHR